MSRQHRWARFIWSVLLGGIITWGMRLVITPSFSSPSTKNIHARKNRATSGLTHKIEIVFERGDQIWIADANTGKQHPVGSLKGSFPAWSPDGTLIAFVGASQESPALFVANRKGKVLRRLPLPPTPAWAKKKLRWTGEFGGVRWSPSGHYVATVREVEPWHWKQVFWDLENRRYWTTPAQDYALPVWSPRRHEYVTYDTFGYKPPFRIILRNPKTKTEKVLLSAKASINYVEWSPTGRQLLYMLASESDSESATIGDPNLKGIWTVRSDGKEAKRIYFPQSGDDYRFPTWSPRGDRIAFVKNAVGSDSSKKGKKLIQIVGASDGKAVKSFRLEPPEDWEIWDLYWHSEKKFLLTLRRGDPNDPNTKPPRYSLAVFDTDRGTSKVLIEEMGNSDFDVHPHTGW